MMTKETDKHLRFFDFFAGIGGFRLGMEMAGHVCVGHCEIDEFADASYRAMHQIKEGEYYHGDIRTIDADDLPDCDVYCFGFPCQSFSLTGKRGGFADTRGTLFFEVMRLAKTRRPAFLLAENVKGLLNHDGGRTFGTIIRTMDELGYDVEWQLLNSKHFGCPQSRDRVFIVGHSRDRSTRQVFPITKGDQQTDVVPRHNCIVANTITTSGVKYITNGIYPTSSGHFLRVNGFHKKNEIEDIPSPIDDEIGIVKIDGVRQYVRRLTPRECFRLQGFPDEYFDRAAKVNSDAQLYKQAGNAVTVNVVYEIAKRFSMEDE